METNATLQKLSESVFPGVCSLYESDLVKAMDVIPELLTKLEDLAAARCGILPVNDTEEDPENNAEVTESVDEPEDTLLSEDLAEHGKLVSDSPLKAKTSPIPVFDPSQLTPGGIYTNTQLDALFQVFLTHFLLFPESSIVADHPLFEIEGKQSWGDYLEQSIHPLLWSMNQLPGIGSTELHRVIGSTLGIFYRIGAYGRISLDMMDEYARIKWGENYPKRLQFLGYILCHPLIISTYALLLLNVLCDQATNSLGEMYIPAAVPCTKSQIDSNSEIVQNIYAGVTDSSKLSLNKEDKFSFTTIKEAVKNALAPGLTSINFGGPRSVRQAYDVQNPDTDLYAAVPNILTYITVPALSQLIVNPKLKTDAGTEIEMRGGGDVFRITI